MPELKKPFPTPIKIQSEPRWLRVALIIAVGVLLGGLTAFAIIKVPKWNKARKANKINEIVQIIDARVGPVLIDTAKRVMKLEDKIK